MERRVLELGVERKGGVGQEVNEWGGEEKEKERIVKQEMVRCCKLRKEGNKKATQVQGSVCACESVLTRTGTTGSDKRPLVRWSLFTHPQHTHTLKKSLTTDSGQDGHKGEPSFLFDWWLRIVSFPLHEGQSIDVSHHFALSPLCLASTREPQHDTRFDYQTTEHTLQ